MRENEPYDPHKAVTEEDVQKVLRCLDVLRAFGAGGKSMETVQHMWNEIQSLRSILDKQMY